MDQSYKLSHRLPTDKPVPRYNGLKSQFESPNIKVTKKKDENEKM